MPSHTESRRVPYSARQMYDLVADVERYPEFLPWTTAARIREMRQEGSHVVMLADLVVSFKVFSEKFGSRVTLWPDSNRINTEYLDGPFRRMNSDWEFADAEDGGSDVSFHVDFEFRNRLLQTTARLFFNEVTQRVVQAFERRAADLYGRG
ncbi:MAG: type II toxin-antitoxin system RatA family toxin [Boseongicola sp. SB0677_bin_26]|nr:type II toxin-antitoxin system RatA family toxin [Boseongicola sp. SB0665_bin_10]MYG28099.1 type II toxin-antitoxin system RatA family toxin [Boseongicola sp. SB0677_bin_26]